MPKGKAPINGGLISRCSVSEDIFFQTIYKNEYFVLSKSVTSDDELRQRAASENLAQKACNAVGTYLGLHQKTPPLTVSVHVRKVRKLVTAANKLSGYLKAGHAEKIAEWNENFLSVLQGLDVNSRDLLHRYLRRRQQDLFEIKAGASSFPFEAHSRSTCIGLDAIGQCDIESLFNNSAPALVDPYLPLLVDELIPVWTQMTGRTAFPTNRNREEKQYHPFAEWVVDFVLTASNEKKALLPGTIYDALMLRPKSENSGDYVVTS